ncbi:MAG: non-lysosomal glucosylceramidase [Fimbriimonadales bacterium]|nr:non-lysosomal glucosylceramidase [Fimbriimonadales bacterium]
MDTPNGSTRMPIVARYAAEQVRAIAMPVGGIGTGCFALGGDGALLDWQLMSRPHRGWRPPYAHMLLRVQPAGMPPSLRVLESLHRLQLDADHGAAGALAGIPRMQPLGFEAAYPFGRALLHDPTLPLRVAIEAFNPLIPEATDDSSLPFGLLQVVLTNLSETPMEATLAFVLSNFIGDDGVQRDGRGNLVEFATAHGWRGVLMRKASAQRSPRWGEIALLCDDSNAVAARRWAFEERRAWGGDLLALIDTLLQQGVLLDAAPEQPCPPSDERSWRSSVCTRLHLPPNGEATARFLLAWWFPYRDLREIGWFQGEADGDSIVRNYYATRFAGALQVAEHVIPRLPELWTRTAQFVQSVIQAHTAPFAESALNCLAVLRSPTCFRLEDGTFCGFEGCSATTGCCHGSCTHVWNYEQATLALFPDLHRSMLEAHLRYGLMDDGAQRFRLDLPLGTNQRSLAAADGQMGLIMRVYQQYRRDGDLDWLRQFYPCVQQMLAFAWREGSWDADRDGVMENAQHNTYDIEFFGPNPMTGVWYLAALRAAAAMAEIVGDADFAAECHRLSEQGSAWLDTHLFNGEYYEQRVQTPAAPPHPATCTLKPIPDTLPYQMGKGCLIDQLTGQYKANRAQLGDLLPREHIVAALRAIYRYNFLPRMHEHYNNLRVYATGDEAGVVICTYPRGERPEQPPVYWAECWTGLEYMFARLLLDYGLREEALQVVRAVRARHDGTKRNPFNEPECGSYYVRSMAAWSLVE